MPVSANIRGAGLMAMAMAAFTINDTFVKLIGAHLPFFQLLFLRSLGAAVIMGAMAWRANAIKWPKLTRDRVLLITRSLAEMAAAYFFLHALIHMPIANVTAILQVLPLTVALGAAMFLGEHIGWRRFVAIGTGLLGVVLIVRPGSEGFSIYSIYALLAVAAVTFRDLAARKLSRDVPSMMAAFVAVLVILVFAAVGALGTEWAPVKPKVWLWLFGSTIMIIAAYQFSISAMRTGDIGFVAPFRYVGLVVALIMGLVVFKQWPDLLTLIGAAIVVVTGLFTLWRERVTTQ